MLLLMAYFVTDTRGNLIYQALAHTMEAGKLSMSWERFPRRDDGTDSLKLLVCEFARSHTAALARAFFPP